MTKKANRLSKRDGKKSGSRISITSKVGKKKNGNKSTIDCTHLVKNILDVSRFTQSQNGLIEIFRNMRHHNSSMRKKGIYAFKDLVKNITYKAFLTDNLNEVLSELPFLILDKDDCVRCEAHKCLRFLFELIDIENVRPFFKNVLTFLQTAMTHISLPVQEDSLRLLDAILDNLSPLLFAGSMQKILPCFSNLIARIEDSRKLSKNLTLKIGQNRQLFGLQWRLKVFSRFHRILKALVDDKLRKLNSRNNYQQFTIGQQNFYPLTCRKPVPGITSLLANDLSSNNDIKCFNEYFFKLVSLLFDTWVETLPEQCVQKDKGFILDSEVIMVLKCILEILQLIWKLIDLLEIEIKDQYHFLLMENTNVDLRRTFMDDYQSHVENHFLSIYPVSQPKINLKDKKLLNASSKKCNFSFSLDFSEDCAAVNILLEEILKQFKIAPARKRRKQRLMDNKQQANKQMVESFCVVHFHGNQSV